ncbi:CFF_collapsed_G0035980.mRNA.1.CDS.1 [Saccharomyces cerevisiae]|nr:CFF_collapsed_G0035980.mRNA.1.CDS.1 [Saccharomyces cerevisiae]
MLDPMEKFERNERDILKENEGERYEQSFRTTSKLDKWTMSNLSPNSSNTLICHLFLSIFVVLWFHFILSSELRFVNRLGYSVLKKSKYQNILYLEGFSSKLVTQSISLETFFQPLHSDCFGVTHFIPKNLKKVHKLEIKLNKLQKSKEQIIFEIILEKYFRRVSIHRHLIANHKRFFFSKLKNHLLFQYKKLVFLTQFRISYYCTKIRLRWKKSSIFPLYYPKLLDFACRVPWVNITNTKYFLTNTVYKNNSFPISIYKRSGKEFDSNSNLNNNNRNRTLLFPLAELPSRVENWSANRS